MKNSTKIAAIVLFGIFFVVNFVTLKDGHNWGDDFAQYIQHAVNLVEHKPYASGISSDLWAVYPPGYPFLLSSVIYWSGVDFKVLKFLNIILWALSAIAVFGLSIRRLEFVLAGLVTVWFLSSPLFFFFKQNVLSDIPFMCFVLLSLWTLTKFDESSPKQSKDTSRIFLGLAVFCMSYAFLIRYAGLVVFLAAILYALVQKREWKLTVLFVFSAVFAWFIGFQFGTSSAGYFDKSTVSLVGNWPQTCFNNLTYGLDQVLGLFIPDQSFLSAKIPLSYLALSNGLILLMLTGILSIFCFRLYHRKISLLGYFTFLYLGATVLWPFHAGERYLLPLMAPLAVYLALWVRKSGTQYAVIVLGALILLNIFVIASNFNFNDDDIYKKEPLEMFQWVEDHIGAHETYMFSKPRVLGLLTHRMGHNFGTYPQDMSDWPKRLVPLRINYLITDHGFDRFVPYDNFSLRVVNNEIYINLVWKNKMFKIFKVSLSSEHSLMQLPLVHQ